MNLLKLYEYAWQREQKGFRYFKTSADNSNNAVAAEIFHKLVQEELKHIAYIRELIETTVEDAGEKLLPLVKDDWLVSRSCTEEIDQTIIESMTPEIAYKNCLFD